MLATVNCHSNYSKKHYTEYERDEKFLENIPVQFCDHFKAKIKDLTHRKNLPVSFISNLKLGDGYWVLVTGYWLLVTGCWLLVTGCWLLVAGLFKKFHYSLLTIHY